MKLFKKLLSYIIAVTMVLSLTTLLGGNVYAAEGDATKDQQHTLTINSARNGHVYDAYQIFSGNYSDGKLTDIQPGLGVDFDGLIKALKEDTQFDDDNGTNLFNNAKTAADVAKVLSDQNYANNSEKVQEFAKMVNDHLTDTKKSSEAATNNTATIENLTTGYYFVKDADTTNSLDVYTRFIVEVLHGTTQVNLKADVPSVEKKVQDQKGDKEKGADSEGYGNTADHEINESFNFKLTATIPAATDVENYKDAYKLVFHDKMSKGITFEKIGSVQLGNKETTTDGTEKLTNTQEVKEPAYSKSNITTNKDGTQDWTLTIADLKKVAGLDFKKDIVVTVIYSAHLNANATVTKASGTTDNSNSVSLDYSNNPNATAGGTHNTTGNTVYVFTYELDNTKVDKADHNVKLDGAEFELQKDGKALTFTYDSGYDSGKGAYRVDPSSDATTLVSGHGNTNTNNPTGIFNMIGLDAGVYTLHETKAPDGYNKMADVKITIAAEHKLEGTTPDVTLTFQKGDATPSDENAFLIENGKGSTLPSTGGMGTTLLYVAGGILVACAAAYVVLNKKRA